MVLTDRQVKVKDIFLDPYNPRYLMQENSSQESIIQKIFKTRDAKELLTSMSLNIKWVNKIVIIEKKNFSKIQNTIFDIDKCSYLVVEGNNRLACLKSGKIQDYNEDTLIPVLVAEKEIDESTNDFEAQLRITQGIANVMVVKEWGLVSKARHLYQIYKDVIQKSITDKIKPHDVYRSISQELGMGLNEVRESIIRYEFYKTIEDISDSIPEEQWGYLEAFDRTKEIREKFGMSQESNLFEIDKDTDGYIEEILKDIPTLIKKALNEGLNSKQFRDVIGMIFSSIETREAVYEKVNEIVKVDSDFNFRSNLEQADNISENEVWARDLEKTKRLIESFPPFAPWASELKNLLAEINTLITQHIDTIK